jgi:hypothetical protein
LIPFTWMDRCLMLLIWAELADAASNVAGGLHAYQRGHPRSLRCSRGSGVPVSETITKTRPVITAPRAEARKDTPNVVLNLKSMTRL